MKIDFVLAWVDGSDPEWVRSRNHHCKPGHEINEAEYRDWDILKYWFRAAEAYAPWVNRIHFVTCGQTPEWMNTANEKLNLVHHQDFIPEAYLPTFNSHTIELNFHRIPGIAEHFVYFNDDMFLNSNTVPEDFFVDGLPCDSAVLSIFAPVVLNDGFKHTICNDMTFINDHFDKKAVMRKDFFKWFSPKYGARMLLKNLYYGLPGRRFSAFHNFHIPSSLCKSTYQTVWELEPALLDQTCICKFRELSNVNQYVMGYYQLCSGNFIPRRADFGQYYMIGADNAAIYDDILNHRHHLICLNDNPIGLDFEREKAALIAVFEQVFPNKSAFEL